MYIYIYVYIHIYIHIIHMYTCTYIYIHVCTCIYVRTYIHTCTCIYIYIYIYAAMNCFTHYDLNLESGHKYRSGTHIRQGGSTHTQCGKLLRRHPNITVGLSCRSLGALVGSLVFLLLCHLSSLCSYFLWCRHRPALHLHACAHGTYRPNTRTYQHVSKHDTSSRYLIVIVNVQIHAATSAQTYLHIETDTATDIDSDSDLDIRFKPTL